MDLLEKKEIIKNGLRFISSTIKCCHDCTKCLYREECLGIMRLIDLLEDDIRNIKPNN